MDSMGTRQLRVIATTEAGTRAALLEARRLAADDTIVLVPRLASSIDAVASPDDDAAVVERYREIARLAGVNATVSLCICRTVREMLRWMLPTGCVVILGGRRRWWWPTAEQRITDLVRRSGHAAMFADASGVDA
jgi:hypothetical protein